MTAPSARLRRFALAAAATGAALGLVGCGLEPGAAYVPPAAPGSLGEIDVDEGATLTITSKPFTEQLILGKIAVLAAASAGFEVEDLTNVPGSVPSRQLMTSGDADMAWEYTGTAWLTYLGEEAGIPDAEAQYEAVREADAENGLTWLPPAPLNNTYAMAVNREFADATGITRMSQIAELDPAERTFCLEPEFNSRADGFTPMLAHYGIERGVADGVPERNISLLDTGAVYTATAEGDSCNFGEVFTTDARIETLDLTVLEDDQAFFPSYNAAAVLSTEVLEEHPELADIFGDVSAALTDDVMLGLNLQVDVEGREPAEVAYDWMLEQGFITEP
jgi:osmoprotectant transport system substrate-binding protein